MNLLIMSDSHMNNELVETIIKTHPHMDAYIHCGDISEPLNPFLKKHLYVVKGNNDFFDLPESLSLTIGHYKILVVHGHLFDVKFSLDKLKNYALDQNYNIVCFGHTHQPYFSVTDHLIMINPGSIRFPKNNPLIPTYCIFDGTTCNFYNTKTHEIVNLNTQKQSFFKSFFTRHKH